MIKKRKEMDPDIFYKALYFIDENPQLTQRELANKLGISLGGVNYCLRSLIDIGHIKVSNFQKSPKKIKYLYLLTPRGFIEKGRLTADFLKRKMEEYEALKAEINFLQAAVKHKRRQSID
jgi:EPS-associated MarR family transcriptional regulator